MFALAIKLMLVFAVLLGGAGVAAAAAQSSLPNEALYPVKLFIEEVQWGSAQGLEAQIDVQLDHAQQRVSEMVQLTDRGAAIPGDVPVRLQTQLQTALQIAAQLDDPSMQAALDRIQLRMQDQLREMEQLHLNDAAQALTQAREMAQLGQGDPQAFRARFGYGRPAAAPPQPQMTPQADPSRTAQPSHTPQPSRTPQPSCTPHAQQIGTPQGQGYGPGPQSTAQPATPVGQGDGHEYGPGPQSTPQGSGGSQATPPSGGSGSGSNGSGSGSSGFGSGGSGIGSGGSGSGSGRP